MNSHPRSDPTTTTTKNTQPRWRRLTRLITFALHHATEKNLTQVAASLTFTTVLGIVPLLAVVLSLLTAFPLFEEFREAIEDFLTQNLMPPAVSANIMGYLNQFAAKASGLTTVGSLALFVTSILLIRTIDEALNEIWQVDDKRPLRRRLLVYWAIVSLGPILTGASLWASSIVAQQSAAYIGELPGIVSLALTVVPFILTALGFTGLFMGVPNCRVYWKDALAGGVATALALSVMRAGFTYYLSRFPSYTIIYGAFATIPIFLLWIYLSWLAVLSGAAMAATLPAWRRRQGRRQHVPGSLFLDAVNVLRALWPQNEHTAMGRSMAQLSDDTNLNPSELNRVLHALHRLGYVVESNDDSMRWVLAHDPRTAELEPLVRDLLIHTERQDALPEAALDQAVALVLGGTPVRLETVFEHPNKLSSSDTPRQNSFTRSKATQNEEAHHAKSQ